MDWFPLYNSIRIALISAAATFVLGIFLAWWVTGLPRAAKGILDCLFTLPLVLPPTVIGFFLLKFIGVYGPMGRLVYSILGEKMTMTWYASVFAVVIVTFPLMYRTVRSSFEAFDKNIIYAGRTLGMSEIKIFWEIIIPTAGPGIASGTILTFARALGEYGATSMLAGNIPGKTGTISQKIAMVIQDGDYLTAGIWVAVVMVIAFAVVVLMNLISGRKMKNIRRW